jgi:uncharacterized protein (DUF427 family)
MRLHRPRPRPDPPADRVAEGQESVWDYPRPPRLEACTQRLRVEFGGVTVADTTEGFRVLETSHPPNYYFPRHAIVDGCLEQGRGSSYCEWKGMAHYFDLSVGDRTVRNAAWGYHTPNRAFTRIADYVAFYPALMDRCLVGDEVATPQPGGFYGGWVTASVVGPFKGAPGTQGW